MAKTFDIDRLINLVSGKQKAESKRDELFLTVYKSAKAGDLLSETLKQQGEDVNFYREEELTLVLLGYSMGQLALETKDLELQRELQKGKLKLH